MDNIKIGMFFKHENVYGYICVINDDNINYIRDSLTRWTITKKRLEYNYITITEQEFINAVLFKAQCSKHYTVPSVEQVKSALRLFITNFDIDYQKIFEIIIPKQ